MAPAGTAASVLPVDHAVGCHRRGVGPAGAGRFLVSARRSWAGAGFAGHVGTAGPGHLRAGPGSACLGPVGAGPCRGPPSVPVAVGSAVAVAVALPGPVAVDHAPPGNVDSNPLLRVPIRGGPPPGGRRVGPLDPACLGPPSGLRHAGHPWSLGHLRRPVPWGQDSGIHTGHSLPVREGASHRPYSDPYVRDSSYQ